MDLPSVSCVTHLFKHWTVPPSFLIQLLLTLCIHETNADVVIIRPDNRTEKIFIDDELTFAVAVPKGGIQGMVQVANPSDACQPIDNPPYPVNSTIGWFVLIQRINCSLEIKVRYAQAAGYQAAIVYNVDVNRFSLKNVSSDSTPDGSQITIPGVLIGQDDGRTIQTNYTYSTGYTVVINPESSINFKTYLLPFAVVVGFCFILMILFMIIKCVKDRRRSRRNRLSSRQLKHLKITKYKNGDEFEVCAICLEDYCEGENLRILPCSHAYHVKCIDSWLLNNQRKCPLCKRQVVIPGVTSDSDSDSEVNQSVSETAPLIRSPTGSSSIYQAISEANRTVYSSPSSGSLASGSADQIDDVSIEGSLNQEYRLLSEGIPGPSHYDSYQGATSADFNSSFASARRHHERSNSSNSSSEDELEEDTFSTTRGLFDLGNRYSVNGEDDSDNREASPRIVSASDTKKLAKKRRSEIIM